MDYYFKIQSKKDTRRVTLNDLKTQLYSLNRRVSLAMQCHNEDAQREIERQIVEVQEKIGQMGLRGSKK